MIATIGVCSAGLCLSRRLCRRPPRTIRVGASLVAAMANLKKQHLWGAVVDEEFKAEYQSLAR